jgi:hypothetical protein
VAPNAVPTARPPAETAGDEEFPAEFPFTVAEWEERSQHIVAFFNEVGAFDSRSSRPEEQFAELKARFLELGRVATNESQPLEERLRAQSWVLRFNLGAMEWGWFIASLQTMLPEQESSDEIRATTETQLRIFEEARSILRLELAGVEAQLASLEGFDSGPPLATRAGDEA